MSRESAYYDDQSKGGGGLGTMLGMKGAVAGAAVGTNYLMDRKAEKDDQAKREADAEIKRESRGVSKPSNFDAIAEAKQDAQDARDRKKISDMGHKKGGMIAKYQSFSKTGKPDGMKKVTKMANGGFVRAADGIAQRGKTRGKLV
jgi:hypothetical protein